MYICAKTMYLIKEDFVLLLTFIIFIFAIKIYHALYFVSFILCLSNTKTQQKFKYLIFKLLFTEV